jgi:NitT/TauT family transport system ATP-binding protein
MVTVEQIVMKFSTKGGKEITALDNINLQLKDGEFFTLLGPSGCGKSTLLYLISGLLSPTQGKIIVNGQQVTGSYPECALVFQEFGLFPWLTARHNIEFGLKMRGVSAEMRHKRSTELLDRVTLTPFADHYPSQLSGGMKQRIGLCRALAVEPKLLLMDEPFASLDPMTREVMQEDLLKTIVGTKLTVIFVTHSIDEAIFLSNRIAIFTSRPGKIKKIITIDHPLQSRDGSFKTSTLFVQMKADIWGLMRDEAIRSITSGEA